MISTISHYTTVCEFILLTGLLLDTMGTRSAPIYIFNVTLKRTSSNCVEKRWIGISNTRCTINGRKVCFAIEEVSLPWTPPFCESIDTFSMYCLDGLLVSKNSSLVKKAHFNPFCFSFKTMFSNYRASTNFRRFLFVTIPGYIGTGQLPVHRHATSLP